MGSWGNDTGKAKLQPNQKKGGTGQNLAFIHSLLPSTGMITDCFPFRIHNGDCICLK